VTSKWPCSSTFPASLTLTGQSFSFSSVVRDGEAATTTVLMVPHSGVVRFHCNVAEDSVLPWNDAASFGMSFPKLRGNVVHSSSGFERHNEKPRLHSTSLFCDGDRTQFIQIFLEVFLSAADMSVNVFSRNVQRHKENKTGFRLVKL
jgi:hypothetical protein